MNTRSVAILFAFLASAANAQRPAISNEQLEALRKQEQLEAQARDDARFEESLKHMPPEEAEKVRRIQAASKLAHRAVNGKENPELVPYRTRMQMFFERYERGDFRRMLDGRLSGADFALLDAFVLHYRDDLKRLIDPYSRASKSVYARAASMSAIDIARELKTVSDRIENAQAEIFRSAIGDLSAEGQATIRDFAFIHVRPMTSIYDPVIEATAEPEIYKEQAVRSYEAYLRGELPGVWP